MGENLLFYQIQLPQLHHSQKSPVTVAVGMRIREGDPLLQPIPFFIELACSFVALICCESESGRKVILL